MIFGYIGHTRHVGRPQNTDSPFLLTVVTKLRRIPIDSADFADLHHVDVGFPALEHSHRTGTHSTEIMAILIFALAISRRVARMLPSSRVIDSRIRRDGAGGTWSHGGDSTPKRNSAPGRFTPTPTRFADYRFWGNLIAPPMPIRITSRSLRFDSRD